MIPKNKKFLLWKLDEAGESTFNRSLWHLKCVIRGDETITTYYCCRNKNKFGCLAKIRTTYETEKCSSSFFSYGEHSDGCFTYDAFKSFTEQDGKIIEEIKKYHDAGITRARDILNLLKKDFLEVKIKQIYNVLSREKKKIKSNQNTFTLGDLTEICSKLIERNNDGKPFVLASETNPIRVLFTHEVLIKQVGMSDNLHLDATYKLNIYGFPVSIVGISDTNRKFFCTAICISQFEDVHTYTWIINHLLSSSEHGTEFNPKKNFIADNAPQISAAVALYGNGSLRTSCWAHINRLMNASFNKLEKIYRTDAKREIYFLQAITSRKIYELGISLFLQKYNQFPQTEAFSSHFKTQYVNRNCNWYEAYDVFMPSTNNALEKFNLTIKDKYVDWTKCDFQRFVDVCFVILNEYSTKIPSMIKILYTEEEMCDEVYNLVFLKEEKDVKYFLCHKMCNNKDFNYIKEKFLSDFQTFREYYEFCSSFVFLSIYNGVKNWKDIICSCFNFVKKKKCTHAFSYLTLHNKLSLVEISMISLKPRRGRKPNVIKKKSALNKE